MVSFLTKGCTVTYFEILKKTSLQILRALRGAGALDKQIDKMLQGSAFFYSPRRRRTFSVVASPTSTATIGELKSCFFYTQSVVRVLYSVCSF